MSEQNIHHSLLQTDEGVVRDVGGGRRTKRCRQSRWRPGWRLGASVGKHPPEMNQLWFGSEPSIFDNDLVRYEEAAWAEDYGTRYDSDWFTRR
jgi:hypothetical protein